MAAEKPDDNIDMLQRIFANPNDPRNRILIEHLQEGGLLAPLGDMLNKLLKDPVLKQALESVTPPKKENIN